VGSTAAVAHCAA